MSFVFLIIGIAVLAFVVITYAIFKKGSPTFLGQQSSIALPTVLPTLAVTQSQLPSPTSTNSQSSILPLYPDLQWSATESANLNFIPDESDLCAKYTTNNAGDKVLTNIKVSGFVNNTTGLKNYPQSFIDYYLNGLQSRGWKVTYAASGGSPGEHDCFEKQDSHNAQYLCIEVFEQSPQLYGASVSYTPPVQLDLCR